MVMTTVLEDQEDSRDRKRPMTVSANKIHLVIDLFRLSNHIAMISFVLFNRERTNEQTNDSRRY